jgi:hypothetical protein
VHEEPLIPEPSDRPWPKPIEYVYVAWLLFVVFGPMMLCFWVLADDPLSRRSVLVAGGILGGLFTCIAAATVWTARTTGASLRDVTRAVRSAAPQRLRRDYLGRRS